MEITIYKNGKLIEGNEEMLPANTPQKTMSSLRAHHGVYCPDCHKQCANAMSGYIDDVVCYQAKCSECGLLFSMKHKCSELHPFEMHTNQQRFESLAHRRFQGMRLGYTDKKRIE